jgi:nucleotide-binding universal stress UspA family protein
MFRSIVVGTDGSDTATRAVREAIDLAKSLGAQIDIVSAYSEHRPRSGLHRVPPPRAASATAERGAADATLEAAAALAGQAGVQADTHAREGEAANAILELAERTQADLIVVGNLGMTGATRFLLGSVPNRISHSAHCSVLIVRTS